MNFAINLEKLDYELLNKYVVDVIGKVPKNSFLLKSISFLQKRASIQNEDNFKPLILSRKIVGGKPIPFENEIVQDVLGPLNLNSNNISLACSFLAGRGPKIYILPYILFSIGLKVRPTIWIDDVVSLFKHNRTKDEQRHMNNLYKIAFKPFDVDLKFTSEIMHKFIIPAQLLDRISKLSYEEFIELIPYDRRKLEYIKFLDLIHPLWQAIILSQLNEDYYLSAINTKRQLMLICKLGDVKRNIIFFPKFEIKGGGRKVYELGQNNDVFNNLSEETIECFYKFYLFAFKREPNPSLEQKRKELNLFLRKVYTS